jgi:hypothetical protein
MGVGRAACRLMERAFERVMVFASDAIRRADLDREGQRVDRRRIAAVSQDTGRQFS